MMLARRSQTGLTRGFTLIEAVVAMVVLAIAVPIGLAMMRDAATSRINNAKASTAYWLANAIIEQVMADLDSPTAGLGFEAFDNVNSYLNDAPDALTTRLASVTDEAEAKGYVWSMTASAAMDYTGATTGDATEDLYRRITVQVLWFDALGDPHMLQLSLMAADRTP